MAFSVREFRELIRLLGKEPERRAELLGVLLGEDMLALPQALRELAQAQTRTEQRLEALTARVDALAARMDELTARVDALAARMDELTARVDALALAQVEMAREMAALARQMRWLTDRVGGLLGESTERRYRERAPAYFDDLLRGLHVPDAEELARILDEAVDAGRISRAERRELLYADVVAFGRRRDDGSDAALAVEVSATVDEDDVRRAAHRAELLSKSTAKPATAVVAGEAIKPTADELAQKMGVWRVLDGRTFSPESGAAPREQALE